MKPGTPFALAAVLLSSPLTFAQQPLSLENQFMARTGQTPLGACNVTLGPLTGLGPFNVVDNDAAFFVGSMGTTPLPGVFVSTTPATTLCPGTWITTPAGMNVGQITSFVDMDVRLPGLFVVEATSTSDRFVTIATQVQLRSGDAFDNDPDWVYDRIESIQRNGSDLVVIGTTLKNANDPAANARTALVRYDLGSANPVPEVLVTTGDSVSSGIVKQVNERRGEFSLDESGSVMFGVGTGLAPAGFGASGIYVTDGTTVTVIAAEGSALPGGGGVFGPLRDVSVDRNSNGQYAFVAPVGGTTDFVVVRGDANGSAILARVGQPVPDPTLSSKNLLSLDEGGTPIFVTPDGDVVWWGRWHESNPNSQGIFANEGIFINERLLVRQGVTEYSIGGVPQHTLARLDAGEHDMNLDASGRYLGFRGAAGGDDVLLGIDLEFLVEKISGCESGKARLYHSPGLPGAGGMPFFGETFQLLADGGTPGNNVILQARPNHALGLGNGSCPSGPVAECGQCSSFGELLINGGLLWQQTKPYSGAPTAFDIAIPSDVSLIGTETFFQASFLGPVKFTNALKVTVGP